MKSEINITSLVDIVLVLLIIFMVVTPLLHQGYDVSTAKKSSETRNITGRFVLIEQSESEYVKLNHKPIPITELKHQLKVLLPNNDNSVIYAGADNLVYGKVAQTLDTIRDSGAGKIAISTEIEAMPP